MGKGKQLQLELLRHYFSIQGNVATLKLVYDTFSELINPNFGDVAIEKLNDKLFSDISEAVSLLPRKFKLDLQIVIKDFGDYTKEECRDIIKQNIYLAVYRSLKSNRRKLLGGCSIIATGALILVASYFLHNYNLWFDLINISGTLFVWEGVNMAFLERSIENKATRTLVKTIHDITIVGEDDALPPQYV